jgi:hypothetical protein
MKASLVGVLSLLLLAGMPASAQDIRQENVQFKKGETSATIKGHLKGDQIVDYALRAAAGQSLVVIFTPSNRSAYFNVTAPDSDAAMFVGSTSGNRFEATLPADGVYTIRVYLMRNAARRNENVNYTLEVGVAGEATKASASAAGPSKWDASGSVKCSAGSATLNKQCGFRVVRNLPKKAADIWVANIARGETEYRFFHYEDKVFTTNDSAKLSWQRQDDNWWVSVDGKEFYLIPDALIHGG